MQMCRLESLHFLFMATSKCATSIVEGFKRQSFDALPFLILHSQFYLSGPFGLLEEEIGMQSSACIVYILRYVIFLGAIVAAFLINLI